MAGDWIKVRDNLHEDPAVAQIATALGIDVYAAMGRLIRIWTWADQQVADGNANVTLLYLDQLVSTPGIADAMVLAGWLEVPENGRITFPKYDRHMSKAAKKRALTKVRVQLHRSNAPVTQKKRRSVTREEKSITNKHLPVTTSTAPKKPRSEKPPTPPTPPPPGASPAAILAAQAGVKLRTERHAPEPDPEPEDPPDVDAYLEQMRRPATLATAASKAAPPTDWEATPEGIDRAGEVLGMKRLPFEDDPEFAQRIRARLELG